MAAGANRRPGASRSSSRYMVMEVTPGQNGILSHERLCSEEGAQDRCSYQHDSANGAQAERKIFYSFAAHISLRYNALQRGTLRATRVCVSRIRKPMKRREWERSAERPVNRAAHAPNRPVNEVQ